MSATYYYIYPFGENADDLTTIPSAAPIDGSVSYFAGWTDLYELDLNTDPTALPIPRGQMNQLFLDITKNIQEYQQYGSPNWIAPSDNDGVPFAYPIYARVYYLGEVYESQVAANTAVPGADATWLKISANLQGVPPGTLLPMARYTTPTGYLYCDGSAVSRSTYATLLGAITNVQNGTTTNTLATVTGLTDTSPLYAGMPVEGTNIPASTTILTIDSGTQITLSASATGSGTNPVTFLPWGAGNGTTTFNVPDMRRRSAMGAGGSGTATLGNALGQKGGAETNTLTTSNLPATISAAINTQDVIDVVQGATAVTASHVVAAPSGSPTATTITNVGGGQAFNIVDPKAIVYWFVKT